MRKLVNRKYLQSLGYKKYQAKDIIHRCKLIMVRNGYSYYNNKRLGLVPMTAISQILGIPFDRKESSHEK